MAELESIVGPDAVLPFERHALLAGAPDLARLGGSIKIGKILYFGKIKPLEEILNAADLPWTPGKTNFGLSSYGARLTTRDVMAAGLTLKKLWKPHGSLRLVTPQQGTSLSAATLLHNGLPGKGFEIVAVQKKNRLAVGLTEQVQDIEAYAARDYARPARSAKVGMLPPKLAQILINTTGAELVADPFCGTGVVPQEALLLGRRAYGSDLSPEMAEASRTNLEWLDGQYPDLPDWQIEMADAAAWTPPLGSAIVTEGYLGPNFSRLPRAEELASAQSELNGFYRRAFKNWAAHLPAGAELALCLPSWRTAKGWSDLGIVDELPDLGYTFKSFVHLDSSKLRYARPDQIVGRRILLLTRS